MWKAKDRLCVAEGLWPLIVFGLFQVIRPYHSILSLGKPATYMHAFCQVINVGIVDLLLIPFYHPRNQHSWLRFNFFVK